MMPKNPTAGWMFDARVMLLDIVPFIVVWCSMCCWFSVLKCRQRSFAVVCMGANMAVSGQPLSSR
jgi:hypothetical protein